MGKIVLQGYYGFGNFGDDILLITTYRIIKEFFPSHEIIVYTRSTDPYYIHKLLDDVVVVTSNAIVNAEWIIHGGGGVFFDFREGKPWFYLLNKAILLIGFRALKTAYNLYQRLRRRTNSMRAKFRAGLGIGIGTYTKRSSKFYLDIQLLSDFDFLLVRDEESFKNLKLYQFDYPVSVATDLAFLREYWINGAPKLDNRDEVIGFVLRDWEYDNHEYLRTIAKVIETVQLNKKVKLFSFDKTADTVVRQKFSRQYSLTIWDPSIIAKDDFIQEIALCKVMVTSRAHGAIIASCLGIPAICLAIEPKLKKISYMLKESSLLIDPVTPEKVISAIDDMLKNYASHQNLANDDIERNKAIMKAGLASFEKFVNHSRS